jgi:hypothetical protein
MKPPGSDMVPRATPAPRSTIAHLMARVLLLSLGLAAARYLSEALDGGVLFVSWLVSFLLAFLAAIYGHAVLPDWPVLGRGLGWATMTLGRIALVAVVALASLLLRSSLLSVRAWGVLVLTLGLALHLAPIGLGRFVLRRARHHATEESRHRPESAVREEIGGPSSSAVTS